MAEKRSTPSAAATAFESGAPSASAMPVTARVLEVSAFIIRLLQVVGGDFIRPERCGVAVSFAARRVAYETDAGTSIREERAARRPDHVLQQRGDDATREERERLEPVEPGVVQQDGGDREDREHGDGEAAVVEEEAGDVAKEMEEPRHGATGLRAARTPTNAVASRPPMSTKIVASPQGHCAPMPSPNQKSPNAETMTPTANLSEFSGTRESGPLRTAAASATTMHAARAPTVAGSSVPPAAPIPITITITSIPSSITALNATRLAIASQRFARAPSSLSAWRSRA